MKNKIKDLPYLLFLLVMPVLGLIYKILNNNPREAVILSTDLDDKIPFLSIFIIPYIIWYAFILGYLIYFWYKDTRIYLKTLTLIVIGELVCFVIYFFFQTTVPRPNLVGDGILIELVGMIYSHDQPYNAFPSIHVLTTFAIILGNINIRNKHIIHSIFVPVMGSLIIISTLFVKQHYILDMFASMFLTSFIYGIVFELFEVKVAKKADTVYVKD
ncbi:MULTISPECIES: phosphatase PAP2 family protein [unclassified Bacillus (in: firmicutes)]|uniref:phosphatase PAP2 family protein n=1 Tax=unclassified Bacillus (in: firmicutes) TaxID=185979 RepID=UPI001BEC60A5|nr:MULTISPECIES: phosphatase PAP2 family protein [unclassified Bacillus (in: firmicutes)]MBT2638287.1 phosphatase PAP2 family protein [Bacillus sp. ISL-39]MBT2661357.1 phosphatase PAP2 family protein [Bacillus sp. ISL-45]